MQLKLMAKQNRDVPAKYYWRCLRLTGTYGPFTDDAITDYGQLQKRFKWRYNIMKNTGMKVR